MGNVVSKVIRSRGELICPHCHSNVPHGASVCRGCKAEIEYGTPLFMVFVVLIVSFLVGGKIGSLLPNSFSFIGWIVGIATLIGGGILNMKMFDDRVNFKRIYHTE